MARMKNSEDLFIERINSKQRQAYHELFQEFYKPLVIFAMKYLKEQKEAEDIVQDLFITIWEKQEKFLSYNSFCVFLYNAVRNTCLNRIKHRKVEEKYIHYSLDHEEKSEEWDFEKAEEEIYRQLFKAIDELPARCRQIFLLHLEGMKNEEIAAKLKLSLLTVKTQKKKAIRHLRERLGHLFIYMIYMYFFLNEQK